MTTKAPIKPRKLVQRTYRKSEPQQSMNRYKNTKISRSVKLIIIIIIIIIIIMPEKNTPVKNAEGPGLMFYCWRDSVVRTSVFRQRTFPDLRLIYG